MTKRFHSPSMWQLKFIKNIQSPIMRRPKTFGCHMVGDWNFSITIFSVCHTMAFPFTLENILKQKKNYGNSSISLCKNIIFRKNPLNETKILQDITTLSLFPSFNTSKNIVFKQSSYIKIDLLPRGQNLLSYYTL